MNQAIIGGTGVYKLFDDKESVTVDTRYGPAEVDLVTIDGFRFAFLPRHGRGHSVPPHKINYRANIQALKDLGIQFIFATAAVGSCSERFAPGDVVVLRDFLDFTKSRPSTFFEDGDEVLHVPMGEPYCRKLTEAFEETARDHRLWVKGSAVYVCTEGPRFETAAEIRMFARMGGEVVGMTSVPEVVLAKEAGICYASVGIVTNLCTGLSEEEVTLGQVREAMSRNRAAILRACVDTFKRPMNKTCCGVPTAPRG